MITEVIPKAQENPIQAPLNIIGYEVFVNFELSKRNLGASGICGVAIYVKDHVNAHEVSFNFGNSYQLSLELLTTSMEGFVPNPDETLCVLHSLQHSLQQVIKGRSCGHSVVRGKYSGHSQKVTTAQLASRQLYAR